MPKETIVTLQNHPARLLSIGQVADLLGVSTKTVRRYHDARRLPEPIRLAGLSLLKWRQADIIAWINSQVQG